MKKKNPNKYQEESGQNIMFEDETKDHINTSENGHQNILYLFQA